MVISGHPWSSEARTPAEGSQQPLASPPPQRARARSAASRSARVAGVRQGFPRAPELERDSSARISRNQRSSAALRGTQRHSAALSRTQSHSAARRGTPSLGAPRKQSQSAVISHNQRSSVAISGHQSQSAVISRNHLFHPIECRPKVTARLGIVRTRRRALKRKLCLDERETHGGMRVTWGEDGRRGEHLHAAHACKWRALCGGMRVTGPLTKHEGPSIEGGREAVTTGRRSRRERERRREQTCGRR